LDGCSVHDDWRQLVMADDVDALIVATPAASHAMIAIAAMDHAKPVFVEKPMALTVADAEDMRRHAALRSAVLHVDHIDLFNAAWKSLVDVLPKYGAVRRVEGHFGCARPVTDCATPARWEWGAHALATTFSLLGAPSRIQARNATAAHASSGEVVQLDMNFDSGAVAKLAFGDGLQSRSRKVSVYADEATVVYDDNAPRKTVVHVAGRSEDIMSGSAVPPLEAGLRRFIAAVRTARPDHGDADLGVLVVRTLAEMDAQLRVAPLAVSPR
jgi:predicted dehydrogenase